MGCLPPERTNIERISERADEQCHRRTEDCTIKMHSVLFATFQCQEPSAQRHAPLQIPPLIKPVNAKRPYKTPLAVSDRVISCVPPAPKLLRALNMPGVQKQVNPTRSTCTVGVLGDNKVNITLVATGGHPLVPPWQVLRCEHVGREKQPHKVR
jgi:hypothetical protein